MDAVRERVAALGLDREGLRIEGVRTRRFKGTRETIMGHQADEYEAYCSRLSLRSSDAEVVLEPGSPEFNSVENALSHHRLPLYDLLVEPGSPAPEETASFGFAYARVDDIYRLDDEWLDAVISGDDAKTSELEWQRFRLSTTFEKAPCDRQTYDRLRTALLDGGHLRSMDFSQYYDWYARSAAKFDEQGEPSPELAAEAERIVDVWLTGTMEPDQIKYWLCRNLSIHPLHRAALETIVDEKTASPRAAAASLRI